MAITYMSSAENLEPTTKIFRPLFYPLLSRINIYIFVGFVFDGLLVMHFHQKFA